ncbi:MAG: hypothetical protein VX938_11855, partial [Myxococcota bacterium]|nr:hypothetical protein [Myxococcota bacterium]
DRYGRAPEEVRRLADLMALKLEAARLGFVFVGFNKGRITLGLGEHGLLTPDLLTRFLNRPGNRFRLTPEMKLVRSVTDREWERGLETLRDVLREIGNFL